MCFTLSQVHREMTETQKYANHPWAAHQSTSNFTASLLSLKCVFYVKLGTTILSQIYPSV